MKKLLVSLMLVLGLVAFAAESAPSATVGYVKYDLLSPGASGYNMIALPMDEGYTASAVLGDAIPNCNQISMYDATSQGWNVSGKGIFGWTNTFTVATGQAYQVNVTAASTFISNGDLVADPVYNLLSPGASGYNTIMHPLSYTGTSFDMSNEIGDDIANCNQISEYDATSQGWNVSGKGIFGWTNTFASEIGKGLQVNVTAATTWPGAKGEEVAGDLPAVSKAGNKNVFYAITEGGSPVDFGTRTITFKGWVVGRETEIQQEFNAGAGTQILGSFSTVFFNLGNLTTPWTAGEFVAFHVKDETDADWHNWTEGIATGPLPLDASPDDFYLGVEAFVPGSGAPIAVDNIVSSIDGNMPLETKLEQNYPNPFNPTTSINFSVMYEGNVKLNVYNYTGQLVSSLVNGQMNAGHHTVNFDASNLSAGVYYYTLEADNKVMTNKMVLVK